MQDLHPRFRKLGQASWVMKSEPLWTHAGELVPGTKRGPASGQRARTDSPSKSNGADSRLANSNSRK